MIEHENTVLKRESKIPPMKKQTSVRPCGNCDGNVQQAREAGFKLDMIQKELFQIKNEKAQVDLESRMA
jgi:hypothetical protein